MTAALLSRPTSKRKSRRRMSDATFVAMGSAIYRMDASTDFVKTLIACCPNEKEAKSLVKRLRAGEHSRAVNRSHDSYMGAKYVSPNCPTLDPADAVNWRRMRAALDQFKEADTP